MSIRQWFRSDPGEEGPDHRDNPPKSSLMKSLLGKEQERVRSLGEYDATSYPQEMTALLRRREEVASELLQLNLTDRQARIGAIPRLQALLRQYPHPLAYEALIHAYVDADRYDEARGVAFAAKERRVECSRSPYPEIRAETDRLREWSPEEVDQMRAEREARK